MIKETILEDVIRPLLARVGTAFASAASAYGLTEGQISDAAAVLIVIPLVGVDLAIARYFRGKVKANATRGKRGGRKPKAAADPLPVPPGQGFGPVVGAREGD